MSFRNPGLLAKICETVDEMSNGRLTLAVGAGWHEPEYTSYGFPFDHRASRFEEGFAMIFEMLRTGTSSFKGRYYTAENAELLPRGPRPNRIPIVVGTNGERLLKLTAELADGWNTTWIAGIDELTPLLANVDAACASVGRDPSTLDRSACIFLDNERPIGRFPRPMYPTPPARSPRGNAEALAEYAAAGLDHVMVWPDPCTVDGVLELGKALQELDRG
jgi:alkanesulfonate monooxygenase SsuD/methylene tetrahydromethanopterin reductase-like flavin-dependent oxidoreductase (luciferase family)